MNRDSNFLYKRRFELPVNTTLIATVGLVKLINSQQLISTTHVCPFVTKRFSVQLTLLQVNRV